MNLFDVLLMLTGATCTGLLLIFVGVSIEQDKGINFEKMGARLIWLARMVGSVLEGMYRYFFE